MLGITVSNLSEGEQWLYVIISYIVTFGGIGLYTWRMLARARKIAPQVREEDRPWT
ncbi:MAG: hypothetical protein ACOYMR_13500 [Ilumatobacteraceae bacterium]|jgi:hypothetical protein